MIQKLDKNKKVIEIWDTVELAAKAAKVSPKVMKGHLKGKPPKLGGFVYQEAVSHLTTEAEKEVISVTLEDFKNGNYATLDEFGDAKLQEFVDKKLDDTKEKCFQDLLDIGMCATHTDETWQIKYINPLSPEVSEALANERAKGNSFIHSYETAEINPDWLLTPLQRRLKAIKDAKNS